LPVALDPGFRLIDLPLDLTSGKMDFGVEGADGAVAGLRHFDELFLMNSIVDRFGQVLSKAGVRHR